MSTVIDTNTPTTSYFKTPIIKEQPITRITLPQKEREFKQKQEIAYNREYDNICNSIIKTLNTKILYRNKTNFISSVISSQDFRVPIEFRTIERDKRQLDIYYNFVCEMYKDFKIEIVLRNNQHIQFKLYISD